MALKKSMTADEMVAFIDNELLPQAKLEIGNWINPKKKQGGYFIVTRQIFCMVDFLGATYSGYPLSQRKNDPNGRRIATSTKAIRFITTFFKPKRTYNRTVITKLHDMYRNGLVHLYQPKILKLSNKNTLEWFIHKGNRHLDKIEVGSNTGKRTFKNVDHLVEIPDYSNKNRHYLPISINCLYEDFVAAVQLYRDKLHKIKYLQTNWRTAVTAIIKPR